MAVPRQLPNTITAVRILCAPVFLWMLLADAGADGPLRWWAAVLFILAVGNVRGFAFTLGLTTIVDVLVVSLFTHPVLQLLAKTRFFGEGHRFSGLDPTALGAVYRGRAQFRTPIAVPDGKLASSNREAQRRQTIAERKAEQELAAAGRGKDSGKES